MHPHTNVNKLNQFLRMVYTQRLFVVIKKPPSHYVLHIDEGFYSPNGLFLHHVTNSKRGFFFHWVVPPYVNKL